MNADLTMTNQVGDDAASTNEAPHSAIYMPAQRGATPRYRMAASKGTVTVGTLAMIAALMLFTSKARAAAPKDFNSLGSELARIICEFVASPVVLVIIAVSLLAALIALSLNEDNRFLTSILKTMIAGLAIAGIGSIVSILNIGNLGC